MSAKPRVFYEFGRVRYYPQTLLLTSFDETKKRNLSVTHHNFLLVLLARGGKTATHEEIWAAAWPHDRRDLHNPNDKEDVKHLIREAKRSVARSLCEMGGKADIIDAKRGRGYWLTVRVRERLEGEAAPDKPKTLPAKAENGTPARPPEALPATQIPPRIPDATPPVPADEAAQDNSEKWPAKTAAPTPLAPPEAVPATQIPLYITVTIPSVTASRPAAPPEAQTETPAVWPVVAETPEAEAPPLAVESATPSQSVTGYVLWASSLYAALFVIALFLEIAYAWDSYGLSVARVAPFVWLWMAGAMAGSMMVAQRVTQRNGLLLAVLWLVLAEAALAGVLSFFLPSFAVTESRFQAQTAFGAYFKNAFLYFLPLGVFLVLMPFHCVAALQREAAAGRRVEVAQLLDGKGVAPAGVTYLKPLWLALILGGMALLSTWLTFNLLNNLKPGLPYNFFTLLTFLRLLGYFTVGLGSLLWYEAALRKIKEWPAGTNFAPAEAWLGLRPSLWAISAGLWLMVCAGGAVYAVSSALSAPHIEQIKVKVLLPAQPGRQLGVCVTGRGFDPQGVRVGVIGPGCVAQTPCYVTHNVLRDFGAVNDTLVENAPLTLAAGDFLLFLQNSDGAKSNPVNLIVPQRP